MIFVSILDPRNDYDAGQIDWPPEPCMELIRDPFAFIKWRSAQKLCKQNAWDKFDNHKNRGAHWNFVNR